MDGGSRIFSSAQRQGGVHVLMSDVDILIKTKLKPREVIAKLRSEGFDEPFEFHVVNEKEFKIYKDMIPELREI
ncbi:hypothetical protein KEJ44_07445 [Candidatus Bathyarchaeota archaeon]|nr:hypothetical protein [Candidatus Bathyarchaeota archaeon]